MRFRNYIFAMIVVILIILGGVLSFFFQQAFNHFMEENNRSGLEQITYQVIEQLESRQSQIYLEIQNLSNQDLVQKNLAVLQSDRLSPISGEKTIAYQQLDFFLSFFINTLNLDFIAILNEEDNFIYGQNRLSQSLYPELARLGDNQSGLITVSNNLFITANHNFRTVGIRNARMIAGYQIDRDFVLSLSSDGSLPVFLFADDNILLASHDFAPPANIFSGENRVWEIEDHKFTSSQMSIYEEGDQQIWLGLLHDYTPYLNARNSFQQRLFLVLTIILIMTLLVGSLVSTSITSPVRRLMLSVKSLASGNYQNYLNTGSQITEIKELASHYNTMLNKLNNNRRYIQELINSLPLGIFSYDAQGNIKYANEFFLELYDINKDQIINSNIDDWDYGYSYIQNENNSIWSFNNSSRNFEVSSFHFIDRTEKVHYLHVIRDITREKKYQEQLRQNERQAAIGKVTAALAHEINNPLGVIDSYLELISNRPEIFLEEDELKVMRQEISSIHRLMKEMMQMARGEVALQKEDINLDNWLGGWEDMFKWQADKKGVDLTIEKNYLSSSSVYFDPDKIRQALLNLFLNSLEASGEGDSIKIEITVQDDNFEITVQDTGQGIEEDLLPFIFEPFVSSKSPGLGSGLGLAVVKSTINLHNGEISVENTEEGTKFKFSIPCQQANINDQKSESD